VSPRHRQPLTFKAALAALVLAAAWVTAAAQTAPTAREVRDYRGLLAAAHRGDLAEIRKASGQREQLDRRDAHGRTALHVATFAQRPDAVRDLLLAGAAPGVLEADRYDAVTIAAVNNDERTLAVLLSHGASAALVTSRYDGTALIAAAHLGHAGVVKQLIAAGAPLDHVNNLHWTALIEAVVLGDGGPRYVETVKALLDAGADVRIADRAGQTPLALARARGYKPIEDLLLQARAR
jgi:ankyrin repeat protein